jgi:hypothetical protein
MRSKFDSPAELADGVIKARGPLEWEGEVEALVMVTITQKNERIAGIATSPERFSQGTAEWVMDVPPVTNKKFKQGPAHAFGMVCARTAADEAAVFQWSEEIVLEKAD